jgi:hypothetical protein
MAAHPARRRYRWVLVNGEVTIRNDTQTGAHSGALLHHGSARAPEPVPSSRKAPA